MKNLEQLETVYPNLVGRFINWISVYWDLTDRTNLNLKNKVLFFMDNEKDYSRAIISFIAGMTDNYATELFGEIISF